MYYTIYKITNLMNGKIYIGSHKTKDLDDNYMGSGKYLKAAQEKYGLENFKKEILFVFDNPEEMYAKEAEIVNEDFLAEENTYNLKVGGFGGWDYLNSTGKNNSTKSSETLKKSGFNTWKKLNDNPLLKQQTLEKMSRNSKRRYFEGSNDNFIESGKVAFKGKKHTEESKKKIGEKNSKSQSGTRNSQFGTRWIHSIELKVSRKIKKEDPLPEGWVEGRKQKF